MERKERRMLCWTRNISPAMTVLLMAFILKAAFLVGIVPVLENEISPSYGVGFGDLYDQIAVNLLHGAGYRVELGSSETMLREPGYPFFLVGVFGIGGYRIESARIANLLLTAGIAFMIMRLTRHVTKNESVALVATLLFLFHPGVILAEARGGVEIVFIFVVMLFMLTVHHAATKGNPWWYLASGCLLGLVVLVRSTPMLFPMFLLTYLLVTASGAYKRLALISNMLLLVVGMVVVMSPWVIRNYMLAHELVPTSSVQGVAAQEGLYTCQNLSFDKGFRLVQQEAAMKRNEIASKLNVPFVGYYYQYFYKIQDELTFNKELLKIVGTEYTKSATLLPGCMGKNLLHFWFLGKSWRETQLNMIIQLPLLGATLGGIYILWKRRSVKGLGIMLTFVVYLMIVHSLIIAHARHSIPVVPFMAIPASVFLVAIWDLYARRRQSDFNMTDIEPLDKML